MKGKKLIGKFAFIFILCGVFSLHSSFAQFEHEGDWFSANTLSSVVKLSSGIRIYEVEGLPNDYKYHTKGGEPDFGNANVISVQEKVVHVGTGVVISKDGLIVSNAHVTRGYIEPEIISLKGDRVGPNGKSIKMVIVNPLPNLMFVGITDKKRIENGDDSQKLEYIALVLEEDIQYDLYRDRAVLQIVATAHMNKDGSVEVDEKVSSLNIPCATFANPFKTSFTDRKVRAIGFPGTGDPNRSARTTGELLGYDGENSSIILHTSYISGGNSGGGLFHKDNLIGINTWDKVEDKSRPLAETQPITYWIDLLLKAKWRYPGIELPEGIMVDWIADDPSGDSYKDEAQVMLTVVSASNKNAPVKNGTLYVHRTDTDIFDVMTYIEVANELDMAMAISYYLKNYTVEEVAKQYGISTSYVENFKSITNKNQLRSLVKQNLMSYFDEWYNGTFYCKKIELNDEEGKTAISVPKNSKMNVTYVSEDKKSFTTQTLTCGSKYLQGPFNFAVGK